MKTRSKALCNYLSEAGVLNGTPEQIAYAKRCYRKLYKRNWKRDKKPGKEIRIEFTVQQFARIKDKSRTQGMKHTTYARNAILFAANDTDNAISPDQLLQVLQLVSMAAIGALKQNRTCAELPDLLQQAEQLLLRHIHIHT